jgi:nicotinate phosphoribosyltransferase
LIIESLLDNDLYKFTMQQIALHQFPSAEAEYKFILRSKVDLAPLAGDIESEIEKLCELRFNAQELNYLRSLPFFKRDYVDFLEDFGLKSRYVTVDASSGELEISIKGPWVQTIFFEIPILAIISELHCRSIGGANPLDSLQKLRNKMDLARTIPRFHFADFGTRRRYSASWHDQVVSELTNLPEGIFTGTSNVMLAMKYGIAPIGTMAHEFIQAGQGLGLVRLGDSQKSMFEAWVREYRGQLGIALSDTINMSAFLRDFDLYFAKVFDGCRQDSGDPMEWGERLILHYKDLGINPLTKTGVFTNALTFPEAIKIHERFYGRLGTSFGIGTNLTNDCGVKPLNAVIKLVRINGAPVAKISDDAGKVVCEDPVFLSYLMQVFKVEKKKVAA